MTRGTRPPPPLPPPPLLDEVLSSYTQREPLDLLPASPHDDRYLLTPPSSISQFNQSFGAWAAAAMLAVLIRGAKLIRGDAGALAPHR